MYLMCIELYLRLDNGYHFRICSRVHLDKKIAHLSMTKLKQQ